MDIQTIVTLVAAVVSLIAASVAFLLNNRRRATRATAAATPTTLSTYTVEYPQDPAKPDGPMTVYNVVEVRNDSDQRRSDLRVHVSAEHGDRIDKIRPGSLQVTHQGLREALLTAPDIGPGDVYTFSVVAGPNRDARALVVQVTTAEEPKQDFPTLEQLQTRDPLPRGHEEARSGS